MVAGKSRSGSRRSTEAAILNYSWDGDKNVDIRESMMNLAMSQVMAGANFWDAPGHSMAGSNDLSTRKKISYATPLLFPGVQNGIDRRKAALEMFQLDLSAVLSQVFGGPATPYAEPFTSGWVPAKFFVFHG